jgi:putative endonuclease
VPQKTYWVYIMTNRSGTLYIGMSGDLSRRVYEHRHHLIEGFTARYRLDRLVYASHSRRCVMRSLARSI